MQKIVEILEWAMDDYYSNNPDPLDQRQPHKIMPNCIYGYILRYMLKFSDFLDKCLVSYIMPHHNNLELNILAARVMVMSLPVIDSSIFPGDADVQKELFKYALESESREMRAYATVLLNPSITPETAHIFRSEIVKLIIQSLTNLKRLYGQMVESGSETASNEGVPAEGIARATDFSELVRSEAKAKEEERARAVEDGKSLDVALGKEAEDRECENREKILENGRENGTAQINGTSSAEPTVENIKPPRPPGSKRTADEAKLTTEANSAKKIKVSRRDRRPINKIPGAMTPLADCGDDELSRSSTVDDMKMVFIGNNKIYPLTIEMEQRMILGFLQCAFEFTDHVSVLTEHSALDVILKYLNVNEYHDIRLLFEALFSLSSMLIHLRLAWDFVNRGGLLRLIGVNRNSVAAAAVCVCLHHISQFDEIMEHVCQAPGKAVDNIVSYAIWQLSHGYESCGGRICVFFQYGLYYKNILDRFDHRDGLRVLFNYGNSKLHDFLYGDFQDNDVIDKVQEKMGEYCQVLRNINVCLTQYILSHILLKYEHIKKNHADKLPAHLKKAVATGKIPYKDLCKKQLKMDPETESKALEVLRHFIPSSGGTFHPISHLRHLGFVTLYIRALALRTEFYLQMPSLKSDVVLGILKIFHYATVSPAVIKDLTDSISFQHGVRCGIRVLLELIDADPMEDAQQVKLALQVLANCFCGADMESLGPSTSLTSLNSNETSTKKSKPVLSFHESEHKIENVMQKAWDAAQENNALMTLIHYVQIDEPFTDADAIHVVACRALNGLARSEKIRQILSKLPLIADNELASLTRGPVLQDRASEHADFVKEARQLIRRVHQTDFDGAAEDLTYEKMVKAKVIKQTKIDFEQTGLQQLIHDYLMQTGFEQSAQMLQIEAGLEPAFTAATPKSLVKPRRLAGLENKEPMKSIFESPNSPTDDTLKSVPSLPFSDELTTRSEASPKCSTPAKPSRKSLSQKTKQKNRATPVENDLKWKVVSKFGAPSTPANQSVPNRRFSHNKSSLLAQQSLPFSNRHMENAISMTEKQVPLKPHKALTDIVTEYFRNQHAHCEQPVVTCPPFSFYYPHRCPKPRDLFRAPINIVDRYFHSQSMPYRHSHTMFNRANRNFAFSHYCPVDLFDMEGETLTACAFSYDDSFIHLGTYSGDVHWMSLVTGRSESSTSCHNTFITSVQHSKDGTLLLTSSVYVPPLSALWRTGDTQDVLHTFADDMDMSFGYTSNDKIIGTQMYTANIYDTNTGELINTLYNAEAANRYQGLLRNKACFNHTDTLALNDGILWDVRTNGRNEIVHKFDKFSNEYCGKFHPNGNEVIISGSVWDIRTNGLLKHVVALDACDYFFNNTGDIIFSVTAKEQPVRDDQFFSAYESNFRVIDSFDYHVVTTVDTKRDIAGFAVDHADRHICTIEKSRTSEEPSICRIYEIGKPVEFATGEDGNEDDDDDNNDDDDDDVDGIFPSSNGTFDSDNSSASTDSSDDDQEDSISDDTEDGIQEMLEDLAQQPGFEDYQSDEEDEGPLDEEDGEGPDPDDDSEYDSDFNPNSDEEDV